MADATTLPFRNDVFDLVVSYSAIEHVPAKEKQREWIKEMARVTKVGGKTVVTTSNRLNFICFLFHPFRIIDYGVSAPACWLFQLHLFYSGCLRDSNYLRNTCL